MMDFDVQRRVLILALSVSFAIANRQCRLCTPFSLKIETQKLRLEISYQPLIICAPLMEIANAKFAL